MSAYRLQTGHVSAATLVANSANIVSNFPNTGNYNPWIVATDGVVSTYLQRITTPTAKDYGYGLPSTRWLFNVLNRPQVEYLIDTFFAGALTVPVTLMTWRFNNQSASGIARDWVILQATARLISGQTSGDTTNVNDLWYTDFGIEFIRGTYLAVP